MALNAHQLAGWHSPRMHLPRVAVHLHDWLSSLLEKVKQEGTSVASPAVPAGERVLLSMHEAGGRAVVATDRALYHQKKVFPRAVDDTGWTRLPWELVGRVTWHPHRQILTLTGLVPTISSTVLAMHDGAEIALLADERVGSTSLVQTRVDMGEHGSLRVLARQAAASEHLVWVVALDDGIDVNSAAVEVAVQAALAQVRRDLGLPSLRGEADPALGLRHGRERAEAAGSATTTQTAVASSVRRRSACAAVVA